MAASLAQRALKAPRLGLGREQLYPWQVPQDSWALPWAGMCSLIHSKRAQEQAIARKARLRPWQVPEMEPGWEQYRWLQAEEAPMRRVNSVSLACRAMPCIPAPE